LLPEKSLYNRDVVRLKFIFRLRILSLALVFVVLATLLTVPNGSPLAAVLLGAALALSMGVQAMLWIKYDPELQLVKPVTALRILSLAIVLILVLVGLKVRSGEPSVGFLFGMAIGLGASLQMMLRVGGLRWNNDPASWDVQAELPLDRQ
jgi:hypothetical protein